MGPWTLSGGGGLSPFGETPGKTPMSTLFVGRENVKIIIFFFIFRNVQGSRKVIFRRNIVIAQGFRTSLLQIAIAIFFVKFILGHFS